MHSPLMQFLYYRYLLYIRGKGAVYLIDRDNSVFSAPLLSFPARKRQGSHLGETLADSVSIILGNAVAAQ